MEEFDIQNSNERETTLNYPLIIGVILALILIGGGTYWYLSRNDDTGMQEEVTSGTETLNDENNESASEQILDSTDVQYQDETQSQEATTDETTEETTDDTTNETYSNDADANSDNKYFIVSGAFSSKTNADNKVETLKADGYNAVIAGQNSNGLYIVAYEGFPDMESAKAKLSEIRETNPQAWIYKKMN